MRTSDSIDQLALALNKAQAVMTGAAKTSTNPFFHSKYADLAEVWETCRKPLTDNGLSFVQSIGSDKTEHFTLREPYKDKDGNIRGERDVLYIWLEVTSRLLHTSEQWIEDTICLPVEADPQAIGKNTTYLRRYGQMALCGIAPEDDDGEEAAAPKRAWGTAPERQEAGKSSGNKAHWCPEHNRDFFKTAKMKAYAHPNDDGTWHYEPKEVDLPSEPETGFASTMPPAATSAPSAPKGQAVCAEHSDSTGRPMKMAYNPVTQKWTHPLGQGTCVKDEPDYLPS
jgi:hypothetical protein